MKSKHFWALGVLILVANPTPVIPQTPDDPLKAYQERLLIEEQRITQMVEADVRKARLTYRTDPEAAVKQLRETLLRVWDHPDLRERARNDLLGKVLAARRAANPR